MLRFISVVRVEGAVFFTVMPVDKGMSQPEALP
jgi:hypothetical protein